MTLENAATEALPVFRYHPDPIGSDSVVTSSNTCINSTGSPIARSSFSMKATSSSKYRLWPNNRDISSQAVTSLAIDADERVHVLVFPLRTAPALRSAKPGPP